MNNSIEQLKAYYNLYVTLVNAADAVNCTADLGVMRHIPNKHQEDQT